MNSYLGWLFLLLVVLLTIIIGLRWPGVARILWVALTVRVAAVLFGYYVTPLPDGDGDALGFEILAWEWSEDESTGILERFRGPHTYFISWIIAILYSLTDRSILMAQSVSIFFGMGTVFTGWLLARKIWGERAATKAGWVLALFPTLILYSALVMRETYVLFFLIVALHGVVDWTRIGGIKQILLAMGGFIGATFFHGAMAIGAIVFLLIVWLETIRRTAKALVVGNLHLKSALLVGLIGVSIVYIVIMEVSVPKLGSFKDVFNFEHLLDKIDGLTRGSNGELGASYPQWTKPSSPIELIYKGPIRVVYFIFSPFPWDIRKAMQLVGLLDSLLYIFLVFLIWRNRKVIWADRAARNILLVLIAYIVVFGVVVGNYGVAIRHRSKLVGPMIVLAASMLPKLIFSRRKKYSKKEDK